jgi:hypothetical protein
MMSFSANLKKIYANPNIRNDLLLRLGAKTTQEQNKYGVDELFLKGLAKKLAKSVAK